MDVEDVRGELEFLVSNTPAKAIELGTTTVTMMTMTSSRPCAY